MQESIINKLNDLSKRYEELSSLLSCPEVIKNLEKFTKYSKEYAELEEPVQLFYKLNNMKNELNKNKDLLNDPDPDLVALATEEIQELQIELNNIEQSLEIALLPKDPQDSCNVFLEIRAGAGGDEAAIFAGDLHRMYAKFAEQHKWKITLINDSPSPQGGYKEIILQITGKDVYANLKFESGAHRVQRIPATESQGRVHTSTCTVAILPEVDKIEEIEIDPKDLRIDTFRSSGAGGQHVNTTDSAIRITHIPTGTVAECQEERSQHKNKAKALKLLNAKILAQEQAKQQAAQDSQRRNLVGTGDRSERIRTYNYPQGRVTDHRINLTLYRLPEIMEGNVSCIVEPLRQEHQADLLANLGNES